MNKGKGEIKRWQDVLVFHFPHYQLSKGSHPTAALFYKNYKLLKFYKTDELKLFDMEQDTGERINLAKKIPKKLNELNKKLQAYLKAIDASMPKKNKNFDPDNDPGAQYVENKEMLLDPNSSYPFQEGKKTNRIPENKAKSHSDGETDKKTIKKAKKKAKRQADKKLKSRNICIHSFLIDYN